MNLLRLFILLLLVFSCSKKIDKEIYHIPLIKQDGSKFYWKDLNHFYKLVFFGYTYCPDICPVALRTMDQTKMIVANKSLVLIFVTIDPQRDTPQQLTMYLSNFKSPIIGLTGNVEDLKIFYKYFNISFSIEKNHHHDQETYGYNHTPFIYFLSPEDEVIKTFPTGISSNTLSKEIIKYIN